jgi:predicted hydrocarbon binding protein/KaiC/GvpD/RAD55 family RecA-like ATPase
MASLAQVQDVPPSNLILLVGPPGSGKSMFCHQAVLRNIERRPVIYVATETSPSKVQDSLKQKGLGDAPPHPLGFVDAFHDTVGLPTLDRPDTVKASSEDLTSLSIAISKLHERMGEEVLLVFDSLTSPYLMNQREILRFIRTILLRLAAEGDAVLACVDEGCGREEDLVAMMTTADGIVKMELKDRSRIVSLVKHPELGPARLEVPIEPERILESRVFDPWFGKLIQARMRGEEDFVRSEVGDFVNLFWPNFARWSGTIWDPKKFPMMMYELNKNDFSSIFKLAKKDDVVRRAFLSWRERILIRLFLPKQLQKVKDIKKVFGNHANVLKSDRGGILEYLEDISKTDEHYFRVQEGFDCWGFENVGGVMACHAPSLTAGFCKALEYYKGMERDWNAVETKCIGLGDPYCEFKLVPGEIPELKDSLEKDSQILDGMHDRLMGRLMGHLLKGKPLVERPALGANVHLGVVWQTMGLAHAAAERYRTALRMGGAKSGKEVGEELMKAGIVEDEAVKHILQLLEHCKVGRITAGETIRMDESCESLWTKAYRMKWDEPLCLFTTGFLNGFFSAVKNQHVKEVRCVGLGDPYCEWEFR